jgi:predicted deacetylase
MLLVSLHDVAPPHLAALRRQREALDSWGVKAATLLVVPDYHGAFPLERSPSTVSWLRERVAAGDEVALHGGYHRQRGPIRRRTDRVRAALFTAGEGECLAQTDSERDQMLVEGKRRLEDLIGGPVRGFVAPAWLEPAGFAAPLAAAGFRWHEGGLWVEHRPDPAASRWRRRRGPVIGFATRTRARLLASLAWAGLLMPAAARLARLGAAPARVALHPTDAASAVVTSRLELVIRHLAAVLPARTYAQTLLHGC